MTSQHDASILKHNLRVTANLLTLQVNISQHALFLGWGERAKYGSVIVSQHQRSVLLEMKRVSVKGCQLRNTSVVAPMAYCDLRIEETLLLFDLTLFILASPEGQCWPLRLEGWWKCSSIHQIWQTLCAFWLLMLDESIVKQYTTYYFYQQQLLFWYAKLSLSNKQLLASFYQISFMRPFFLLWKV